MTIIAPQPAWATHRTIGDEDCADIVQDSADFSDGDFNVTIDRFSRRGVVGDFDTVIDFTNRYSTAAEREEFAITIAQVPDLIAVLLRVLTEVER